MSAVLGGLGVDGKLITLGAAPEPLEVPAALLISGRPSIVGWPASMSLDTRETLAFDALTGARSMNEVFSLEHVSEAYERMMSGNGASAPLCWSDCCGTIQRLPLRARCTATRARGADSPIASARS